MKRTSIFVLVVSTLIAVTMAGCMEYTTETEVGTSTYNIADGTTVTDVDMYAHGLHITGKEVLHGGEVVWAECNVDGYIEGNHVTGTITQYGDNDPYYDWHARVDTYENGMHITGTMSLKGYDAEEWYYDLKAEEDGYTTGYLKGYANDAKWAYN